MRVSLLDLDQPSPNDVHIGMQSRWGTDVKGACKAALDGKQFKYRNGQVTGGWMNIRVG